jgi:hypothetical protein
MMDEKTGIDFPMFQSQLNDLYGDPHSPDFQKYYLVRIDLGQFADALSHVQGLQQDGWFGFKGNYVLEDPLKQALRAVCAKNLAGEFKTFDGCFNIRSMKSNSGMLSVHSWGLAIDLNQATNPFIAYGNRFPVKTDFSPELIKCFAAAGFEWGGLWQSCHDSMHFQLPWTKNWQKISNDLGPVPYEAQAAQSPATVTPGPPPAGGSEVIKEAANYQVTAATWLNTRSGPGTGYEIIGGLAHGDVVISPDTADWLPILLEDDSIGWVNRQYVEAAPEGAIPPPSPDNDEEVAPQPIAVDYDYSSKEGNIAAIKAECQKQGLSLATQTAYVLATADWETGSTFKPVREAFYISEDFDTAEAWRKAHLGYYPYYGRGYVQLTWEDNYHKYSKILGVDLVSEPDKALEPGTALFILVHGFKTGTFTGKKITDFINEEETDFYNARRCINRLDRAGTIAQLAEKYQQEMGA